jgi:hypothetical protein
VVVAEPTFRLPVAGFEQISRILRSYLAASKATASVPVKLDDVAKRAAMSKTAVSGNNAFLASLGLIEGGNNKQLTDLGLRAALTLDHPATPEAYRAWTDVIEASPDLERVVDAVRIRKGMDEDALLSHIVLTAGAPKTARTLTGARTIVDILEFAGVVNESEGTFSVTSPEIYETLTATDTGMQSVAGDVVEGASSPEVRISRGLPASPGATLNVHVWVNAKEADFEALADELKAFLSKLAEP